MSTTETKLLKTTLIMDKIESLMQKTEEELIISKKAYDNAKQYLKQMRRVHQKLRTKVEKTSTKQKSSRKPCGFARPTKVSEEMCQFLGKEVGTEISRTEVTKSLIQYIKDNNLQNAEAKREILPDEKLKKLFGKSAEGEVLTYFTMQKFVNHHFIKSS